MPRLTKTLIPLRVILQCLHKYEYSYAQLEEKTGLNRLTIGRYINLLRQRPGNLIRVSRWKRSSGVGPYTAYYTWGPFENDEPRPPPLTRKEKKLRQHLANQRKDLGKPVDVQFVTAMTRLQHEAQERGDYK